MKNHKTIPLILFAIIFGLVVAPRALAQAEEEYDTFVEDETYTETDEISASDEDFTGTLSEEDPDNENLQQETELFGTDEAGVEANDEPFPTHLLSVNFEGHVVISDRETTIAYLEIFYNVKIEQEIEVKQSRSRVTSPVEITTSIVGSLAGNDLFSCGLDVGGLSNAEAESMTIYTVIPETEETLEQTNLAVQVKFTKKLEEDWFADCLSGEFNMKTQGDTEEFLYKIWEGIEPDPKIIAIEDYDIYGTSEIDLYSPPLIIDDEDTGDEFEVSGQGELIVEPL